MNAGNGLWNITATAFNAFPNGDIHFMMFETSLGQLSADGEFSNSTENVLTTNVLLSEHTFNSTNFTASGNVFTNTVDITMAGYHSGRLIGSYAIVDTEAASADEAVIFFYNLSETLYIPGGDSPFIPANALQFTLI